MTIFFTIEGNIGSGKSTLLEHLKTYFNKQKINVGYVDEPVNDWAQIVDSEGKTILEKYYADQTRYAFAFQMMAYITRLVNIKKSLALKHDVIILERTMITDREVFAKMLYDDGKMSDVEYQIYNKWFNAFTADIPEMHYIYVKTTPSVSLNRIAIRNRTGEAIPIEYLVKCDKYHEAWLNKIPETRILKINSNHDFDREQYLHICELVGDFITKKIPIKHNFCAFYDMW
jgi:deoxyguanosine kinase